MRKPRQTKSLRAPLFALAIGLSTPALSLADTTPQSLTLPAQPLDQAVIQLAEETGLIIAGDASLLQGKNAPALQGEFTAGQALERLLQGSGVSYEFTGKNTVLLIKTPATDESAKLPPVEVSATAIAAGQTSLDYDKAEMDEIQPRDLKELYRKEPGISVGGSLSMNQKVYVRGVEETALAVSVDGARQNNKIFHHNATNLIDPALLKAVKASPGVSAADDGPAAIGGSLRYETVDVADVLDNGKNIGGFVHGRYGSNGDQYTRAGALYGQAGGMEFLGYLNSTEGNDYEDGEGNTVSHTEPALFSGLAKVAYENKTAGRFEISHEQVNDDSARPYRANFIGLSAGRPVPESRVYDLTRSNTIFSYSRDTGAGSWNPIVTIARSETQLDTRENPLSDPSTEIVYTGITNSHSGTLKNIAYQDFAEISAGLDVYNDSAVFKYSGDPDIKEEAQNAGVFVQLRQPLGDRMDLSYGLRYDMQGFTGTDDSTHYDHGASGNLYGEYQFNDYVTINAGYAQVWGGVALAENFILNSDWDYTDMKAVESENYTLGVRTQFNGWVAEVNGYRTNIENGRVPSWSGGPGLVADFDIEGYDLAMGYVAQQGEVFIKYANIKSDRDGNAATSYDGTYFTAPLGEIITLHGHYSLLDQQLKLGASAEVTLNNDAVASSGAEQEGYTVLDIYADYQLLSNFSMRLSIDNVTDEDYADRASYGQEFVTVEPFLEPGRSYILSARYNF